MPDVDVLVVGAGPAGAVAAWEAKRAAPELDVLLLERDRAVGAPVRCAEGVGDAGLREFASPDAAPWVARKITRVVFIAPDDTEVGVAERDVGWILDRTRFDAFLAAQAVAQGAELRVGTEAAELRRVVDGRWEVWARGAAHMINPLSGGGIGNAMKAGRLAGRTAAAAIREGDTSGQRLAAYHRAWMELLGEDHLKYYRIKQALEGLDDDFFNALARTVNGIPQRQRTLGRILAHALLKHPQLIPVAARFFM